MSMPGSRWTVREDLDLREYLAKLPDRGRCLTSGSEATMYITEDDVVTVTPHFDAPFMAGFGAVDCSTCTDLAVIPGVIWDVNRYYRKLGIPFPYRPTKRELRLAYLDSQGEKSVWLTYVFKNLLKPRFRRAYDIHPLGQPFLDKFVQEYLKRKALAERTRRAEELGREVEVEEVLEEWGLGTEPEQEYSEDSAPEESSSPVKVPWRWSFYVWRSSSRNTERLAQWQQLLISALAERKIRCTFSVGIFGKQPHPYLKSEVQGRVVFFLHEDAEPTAELAARAAREMLIERTDSNRRSIHG